MDMIVNERKQNLGEKVYLIALVFGITGSLLVCTMFTWAPHAVYLIRIGVVLCLIKSLFFDRYTLKQLFMYLVCLGSAILSYDSARHDMLWIIPFIFAAKDVDFKKIIKVYFWTILLLLLTVNILALNGKILNLVFFRDGKPRISYGFTYPTIEAAHIFYLILAYVAYKKFNLNIFQDLIIAFLGYFIIAKGDARLDGYLTFMILFVVIFRKIIFKVLSKLNNFIPSILVITLIIGYIVLSKKYNPTSPTYFNLNNILSNRLFLTQEGLLRYPVKLFGEHVQMQGFTGYAGLIMTQTSWMIRNYFYIDNVFVQTLLINGLILFVIMLATFAYLAYREMKLKNYSFVIVIIFLTVAGLIEVFTIQISYNIFAVMVLANTTFWVKERNGKNE